MRSTKACTAVASLTSRPRPLISGGVLISPVSPRSTAGGSSPAAARAAAAASASARTAFSRDSAFQSAITTVAPASARIEANA